MPICEFCCDFRSHSPHLFWQISIWFTSLVCGSQRCSILYTLNCCSYRLQIWQTLCLCDRARIRAPLLSGWYLLHKQALGWGSTFLSFFFFFKAYLSWKFYPSRWVGQGWLGPQSSKPATLGVNFPPYKLGLGEAKSPGTLMLLPGLESLLQCGASRLPLQSVYCSSWIWRGLGGEEVCCICFCLHPPLVARLSHWAQRSWLKYQRLSIIPQ